MKSSRENNGNLNRKKRKKSLSNLKKLLQIVQSLQVNLWKKKRKSLLQQSTNIKCQSSSVCVLQNAEIFCLLMIKTQKLQCFQQKISVCKAPSQLDLKNSIPICTLHIAMIIAARFSFLQTLEKFLSSRLLSHLKKKPKFIASKEFCTSQPIMINLSTSQGLPPLGTYL